MQETIKETGTSQTALASKDEKDPQSKLAAPNGQNTSLFKSRQNHRVKVAIPYECRWEDQMIQGQSVNLSFSGGCFSHPVSVPTAGVEISITLFAKETLDLRGRVIFSGSSTASSSFGIEFIDSMEERVRKLWSVFSAFGMNTLVEAAKQGIA